MQKKDLTGTNVSRDFAMSFSYAYNARQGGGTVNGFDFLFASLAGIGLGYLCRNLDIRDKSIGLAIDLLITVVAAFFMNYILAAIPFCGAQVTGVLAALSSMGWVWVAIFTWYRLFQGLSEVFKGKISGGGKK